MYLIPGVVAVRTVLTVISYRTFRDSSVPSGTPGRIDFSYIYHILSVILRWDESGTDSYTPRIPWGVKITVRDGYCYDTLAYNLVIILLRVVAFLPARNISRRFASIRPMAVTHAPFTRFSKTSSFNR